MKQIDQFDSTHLNFPDSAKNRIDKFGAFLLTLVGVIGLLAIFNPTFQTTNSSTSENEKVGKFWLTPSTLNAEKTALNSTITQSTKANNQMVVVASSTAF